MINKVFINVSLEELDSLFSEYQKYRPKLLDEQSIHLFLGDEFVVQTIPRAKEKKDEPKQELTK